MQSHEQGLLDTLAAGGVDLLCTLPCDRVKGVIALADSSSFQHVRLTREEEGVGICAGAALAGRHPAMLVQSSGVGNMVNALLSLIRFYELPLAIFVSHRGLSDEPIEAQKPLGQALPALLEAMGITYDRVDDAAGIADIEAKLTEIYRENRVHAFLLNPAIWKSSPLKLEETDKPCPCRASTVGESDERFKPVMSRFDIIDTIKERLEGKAVICNLGIPSKELYALHDRQSNFYMLGSMGMATPIGLGVALFSDREVIVIDGDGSLLMNTGTLATVAAFGPANLSIVAIDNAVYGSTGCQSTLTGSCVDLEAAARGLGIKKTAKAATREQIMHCMNAMGNGPFFAHVLALPGNEQVANIPLDRLEIRDRFRDFLKESA
jgi:sulfopyruvate decarboxylase beta subunit